MSEGRSLGHWVKKVKELSKKKKKNPNLINRQPYGDHLWEKGVGEVEEGKEGSMVMDSNMTLDSEHTI